MAKNDFPVENRLVATGAGGGRRGRDARRGQGRHTHYRVWDRGQWGFAVCPEELGLGLGECLGGWAELRGDGDIQEGGDVCSLWLIQVDVWQRPTQHCQAIILQLKIN